MYVCVLYTLCVHDILCMYLCALICIVCVYTSTLVCCMVKSALRCWCRLSGMLKRTEMTTPVDLGSTWTSSLTTG